MTAHLFDKCNFIWLKPDFSVFFTAGSTLSALLKQGVEIAAVEGLCHSCGALKGVLYSPVFSHGMVFQQFISSRNGEYTWPFKVVCE